MLSWQNFAFAGLFIFLAQAGLLAGYLWLGMKFSKLEKGANRILKVSEALAPSTIWPMHKTTASLSTFLCYGSIVTLTVLLSLLIHGNTATLAMRWIDDRGRRRKEEKAAAPG